MASHDLEKVAREALEKLEKQKELSRRFDSQQASLALHVAALEENAVKNELKIVELSVLLEGALRRINALEQLTSSSPMLTAFSGSENVKEELLKKEKRIQLLEQQLAEQQNSFQEAIKISEQALQDILQASAATGSTESKKHPAEKYALSQNSHGNQSRSPKSQRAASSPAIVYPPGYNPRMRRFSVSAEPMQAYGSHSPQDLLSKVVPKDSETRQRIMNAISHNILFKHLTEEQLEQCVDIMFEKRVAKGEIIIRQGDDGDNFYVIDEGELDILQDDKLINTLGIGRSFGELALMYNVPRNATVKAKTNAICWGMERTPFKVILMEHAKQKRELHRQFLSKVPILSSLQSYERDIIADALEVVRFEDGDVIIRQGEEGDMFYIISKGEVKVLQSRSVHGTSEGKPIQVQRLSVGAHFGELALINNKPRAASVIAVGDVECLTLNRKDFEDLMGPCEEIIKRHAASYKTAEEVLSEQKQEVNDNEQEQEASQAEQDQGGEPSGLEPEVQEQHEQEEQQTPPQHSEQASTAHQQQEQQESLPRAQPQQAQKSAWGPKHRTGSESTSGQQQPSGQHQQPQQQQQQSFQGGGRYHSGKEQQQRRGYSGGYYRSNWNNSPRGDGSGSHDRSSSSQQAEQTPKDETGFQEVKRKRKKTNIPQQK